MLFVDYVYETVKENTKGFDAVYGDYIRKLVGLGGLTSLLVHGRLETCGVINGRQLYSLCDVREKEGADAEYMRDCEWFYERKNS